MNENTEDSLAQVSKELSKSRILTTVSAKTVDDFIQKCNRYNLNYIEISGHSEIYAISHKLKMIMRACSTKPEEVAEGSLVVQYESKNYKNGNTHLFMGKDVDVTRKIYLDPDMRDTKKLLESKRGVSKSMVFIMPTNYPDRK